MIRLGVGLLLIAAVIVAGLALSGQPGSAELTWLGWRVTTTAAAAVLIIGFLSLLAVVFWRAVSWLLESPMRAEQARAEARRRQGVEAVTRGLLAAAAGEGAEARRLAGRAAELADETPQLVRLLAAQAAEADADRIAARAAYAAMLGFPEMRLAAHRGLMSTALAEGDRSAALDSARAAYSLAHTAPWAWRALFDDALERADWAAARALAAEGLDRKVITPIIAERARAALQTVEAALAAEAAAEPKAIGEAAEQASAAARAHPDFTPAAIIAARALGLAERSSRAAPLLETAWKARPHPALWLAWRDLRTDETPAARARRLAEFAALAPGAREARLLRLEQALIAADPAAVRQAAAALAEEPPTARLAALRARAALFLADLDEARAWIARAEGTPAEPDWSDVDETGRAFAGPASDWARLVRVYALTGDLAHPRFERGERELALLPRLPAAYADADAAAFAAAAGAPYPAVLDDSDFSEALEPAAPTSGPAAPRPGLFRSLGGRGKGR